MTPDVGSLRAALERGAIPLAKWLPSGKAAHLTDDDYEWLAETCRAALAEPVTPEPPSRADIEWLVWFARKQRGTVEEVAQYALDQNPGLRPGGWGLAAAESLDVERLARALFWAQNVEGQEWHGEGEQRAWLREARKVAAYYAARLAAATPESR